MTDLGWVVPPTVISILGCDKFFPAADLAIMPERSGVHTFYKSLPLPFCLILSLYALRLPGKLRLRLIPYFKAAEVTIAVYVMRPGDSRWKANLESRNLSGRFEGYKQDAEEMEFPNPAEGIDEIYVVTDGIVTLRMESPRPKTIPNLNVYRVNTSAMSV